MLAACVAPAAWGEDTYVIDGTINGGNLDLLNLNYSGNNGVFIRAASGQDVTDEVGTLMVLPDLAKLVLAGQWSNDTTSASSFESLIISTLKVGENGTGNVNLQVGTVQGNNTKSNTVTIGGVQGTITGLELANNSTLTLSGALTTTAGSSWTLAAGTNLILDNAGTIVMRNQGASAADNTAVKTTGTGTLTIGNGTTVELANGGQSPTCAIEGAITVKGGGTLLLSGYKSLLGFKSSANEKQAAVTLEGSSADSKAVVNITSTEAQHLSRDFVMKGNAEIKGVANAYLETYNGGFIATGTNNIISTKITVNRPTTVETTNAGDTLEISGAISGDGKMTKSGAGTLTLSGTNTFNGGLEVNAGTLILSGTNTISTFNTTGGQTDFGDATTMTKLTTTGGSSIIKGSAKVTETLAMQGGGNIDFTAGTHNIKKLDIHNSSVSTTETLTIAGATVTITGGDQTEFGENQNFNTQSGAAAVVLGHWHDGTGNIIVGGETASASVLDVSGATIRMSWDSSSNLNIKQNGTVYAKGLQFANNNDNAVITLEGGRLNIGEGGLTANTNRSLDPGKKRELNLNSGTLGALADTVNITAGTTTIGGSIAIDTAIVGAGGAPTDATSDINFTNNIVLAEDAALTIKGGGSVSFGSLAVNKTLAVTATDNTTLDITTLTVDPINHGLTEVSRIGDSYYTNDGTAHTTNGFKVENVTYRLFDGYVWSGDVAGFTVGEQDGDTVLSQSGTGSIYFVNTGEHSISSNTEYITQQATGGYYVAEAGTLNINDASILPKVRLESANSKLYYQDADGNNLLQFSGDMGSAGLSLSANGTTVTASGTQDGFTGNITVLSGTTLQASGDMDDSVFGANYISNRDRTITVQNNAVLDVKGTAAYYHVVLEEGATLQNTGGSINTTKRAVPYLDIRGDATVMTTGDMVMQKGGADEGTADRKLALNGHKLTKTGSGNFIVYNGITLEGGNGTIEVDAGSFQVVNDAGWSGKVNVIVDAGNFQNKKANATHGAVTVNGGYFHNTGAGATFDAVTVNGGYFHNTGAGATFDAVTVNGGNDSYFQTSGAGTSIDSVTVTTGYFYGSGDTTITNLVAGADHREFFISSGTTTVTGAVTADATTGLKKNGAGTLVLNGTAGKLDGSKLIVNNGTVCIQGSSDGNAMIAGSIEVNKGGTLQIVQRDTLGYKDSDIVGHNSYKPTVSITAQGKGEELAEIQLGGDASVTDNHQTLSTNLILKGATEMSGGEFSSFGGNVTVSGTNNTIKSAFQLRKDITFSVAESGTLTMEGAITDFAGYSGTLTKGEAGTMTISGNITSARTWKVEAGELELTGEVGKASNGSTFTVDGGKLTSTNSFAVYKVDTKGSSVTTLNGTSDIASLYAEGGEINYGAGTHSVGSLDMSCTDGVGNSTVTLKKNTAEGKQVVLTASTLWLHNKSTLNIEEGATLKLGDNGIVNIKGTAAGATVSVASEKGRKYLINGEGNGGNATDYTISNADVTIASGSEQTIGNVLNNSSLINDSGTAQTSTGKVIANNQANSFVDVKAITGNIELMNLVNGGVQNLEVAAGKSVVATDTNSAKATVSVSGQATFGAGATLSANLTLESNAELVSVGDENGISLNGGTLTLGGEIGLGKELKGKLDRLTGSDTLVLFTNVSDLTLNDAAVDAALRSARNSGTTSVNTADASAVIAGIAADQYTINFAQNQVFLSAMPVPEPTTSMLGLVGLVALTFRRRRK